MAPNQHLYPNSKIRLVFSDESFSYASSSFEDELVIILAAGCSLTTLLDLEEVAELDWNNVVSMPYLNTTGLDLALTHDLKFLRRVDRSI